VTLADVVRGRAVAVLGAAVLWLTLPAPSFAGCTNIPDPPVEFAWRGGTIDRAFLSPGDTVRVTINTPGDPTAKTAAAMNVGQVQVFVKPLIPKEAPRIVLTSTRGPERKGNGITELFPPSSQSDTSDLHLSTVAAPGALLVNFDFNPRSAAAGPALLAIAQAGQAIPDSLAMEGCNSETGRALLACIDEITPPPSKVTIAERPTALMLLGPDNDFSHVCNDGQDCDGSAATVCFTVDPAGGALIRMSWIHVLHIPPGKQHRKVSGSSSVPAFRQIPGRIRVPNEDFLEAGPLNGGSFGTKPWFVADDDPNRPNELTLSGKIKRSGSLLHIRRRRAANRCTGGPNKDQLCVEDKDCPASTCPALGDPMYFTCTNAANRPCTRDADCSPGTCGGSMCWTATNESTTAPCKRDSECNMAQGEECGPSLFDFRGRLDPNGWMCISREPTPPISQPTPPTGQPTQTATPTFAGVCDAGANQGQPCSSTSQCATPSPGSVECVGFRAAADGYE